MNIRAGSARQRRHSRHPRAEGLLVIAVGVLTACGDASPDTASAQPATTPSATTPAADPEDGDSSGECWAFSPSYGTTPDGSLGGEASPEAALDLWAAGLRDAEDPIDPAAWTRAEGGLGVSFTQGTWSVVFSQAPAGDWVVSSARGCS